MNLLQHSLLGGTSFRSVDELLSGLDWHEAARRMPGVPYTLAGLVYHLSVTQRASLDLASGRAEAWPVTLSVWPDQPPTRAEFEHHLADLRSGLAEAQVLAGDPSSRAREVLADLAVHSAYHWGQVALLRRQYGTLPLL
ncbi:MULTISPECIES: damage-inducible protein DinB [Deinococcus]|uniref:Damage-inducible protein DinB n=1 Tax=Deinococcus rufus TaxID=2136097 RepID=A0ABV7ZCH0_9DEIO|nr:damage-inducible protein DinB [Deinococcus sp. AB2017081]WQE93779.1 damage-inducible protein DinB [Deinococcus sp. AB2017081]